MSRVMVCVNRPAQWMLTIALGVLLTGSETLASIENIRVFWENGKNRILDSDRDGLAIGRPPAGDEPAPRDERRFRLVIEGAPKGPTVRVSLVSLLPRTGRVRDRLTVHGLAPLGAGRLSTPWIVAVADRGDRESPALAGRAIRAGLGDRIEARVRVGGSRYRTWTLQVGRPGGEDHPLSIRRLRLRAVVLRAEPGGPPIAGGDEAGARRLIAHQVRVLNEVLATCGIWAGEPDETEVILADPPNRGMLTVGDRFGFRSAGGEVRLSIDGQGLGPWKIGVGNQPRETAQLLAHRIARAGYLTSVSPNPRKASLAFGSADIIVRRPDGSPARIEPWIGAPLTTDPRQSLALGAVVLADGIDTCDFDPDHVGSLEERTLIKSLTDGNAKTVDLFVINRFASGDKQGESFVRSSGSPMENTVLLDLGALHRARHSYTLAHEIGHILLDDLGHRVVGTRGSTERLMHPRSSSAVNGPKRLTRAECEQMRRVSADLLE